MGMGVIPEEGLKACLP